MELGEFDQDTTILESETTNTQTEDQPTKDDKSSSLGWILGIGALLGVGAGGFFYLRSRK